MKNSEFNFPRNTISTEESHQRSGQLELENEMYCQAVLMLHNFFTHFSLHGRLEKLRFDWIDGEGPNPLLLDEEVGKEEGAWRWFSAPGIVWKGLKEIQLGGVETSGAHVKEIKVRMERLEKMMVWEEIADLEIEGKVKRWMGKNG